MTHCGERFMAEGRFVDLGAGVFMTRGWLSFSPSHISMATSLHIKPGPVQAMFQFEMGCKALSL